MTAETTSSDIADEGESIVRVSLGDRSYDIVIGEALLAGAGERIAALLPRSRCAVVTDRNVAAAHLEPLRRSLQHRDLFRGEIVVEPGEASKSFAVLESVSETLLEMGVERGDCVVAFGGGVVGDLAGFAASILRRGVHLVQIPTSLLAQVDSSVGGKTAIDTPQGKNLIGTFYQPELVLADMAVLTTLPERELRAGYAEVVKYGLLGDAPFFGWLEENWRAVLAGGDVDARRHAIATSCKAKAAIVAEDEREESGRRALLNLGHTFGHALEAFTGYSDRLLHGEAIAIGMVQAFEFSVGQGLCPAEDAARAKAHFEAVGLPTSMDRIPGGTPGAAEMLKLMTQDKKVTGGAMNLVLVRAIGEAFLARDVDMNDLTEFLKRECGSP